MKFFCWFVAISSVSFSGCLHPNSSVFIKTTDVLLKPEVTNSSVVPYGIVLGGVYLLEKTPLLKKIVNKPNRLLMARMQREKLFEKNEKINLLLDADFSMKHKMKHFRD